MPTPTKNVRAKPRATTDRRARRKQETRGKMVQAAAQVFASKGIAATTIQDITNAADVGFGSFYNYFEAKEAIVEAVMAETIERFGDNLDLIAGALTDPAEVVSASIRFTVAKAGSDSTWWKLLVSSALEVPLARQGLMRRMSRDIKTGIEAGRFEVSDVDCTVIAAAGAVATVTRAWVQREIGADAPERTAALVLQLLGLSRKEAVKIAARPLPDIGLPH